MAFGQNGHKADPELLRRGYPLNSDTIRIGASFSRSARGSKEPSFAEGVATRGYYPTSDTIRIGTFF